MDINKVPSSIPESKDKKALLDEQGIEYAYLGQGLMFVPPESATEDYNTYLKSIGVNPETYPLSTVQQYGKGGDIYNSARVEELWKDMNIGRRDIKAFETVTHPEANRAMENFFQVNGNEIATMQADNLQDGLKKIRSIIAKLTEGNFASRVILPEKFKYSGHTDFVRAAAEEGGQITEINIPEIQPDGTQDFGAMREAFELVKAENRVGIIIDQEMNNNASGFDRDPKFNEELAALLKEYQGTIFYVGDIAYKGMKEEKVTDPYPLMQELANQDVTAFFYFSPTKITCYRKSPSFKSTVFATPGEAANTDKLRAAFKASERAPGGIGCTSEGAELMEILSIDPKFHKEVAVLRHYLNYVLNSIGSETNGIFRCLDSETIATLNAGEVQAVTVGLRENIWPLGDPKIRDIYKRAQQ